MATFRRGLPLETWWSVHAWKNGHVGASLEEALRLDDAHRDVTCEVKRDAAPVTIVLHRPGTVEGTIRDSTGTALKDFEDLEAIALAQPPAPPPPGGEHALEPPSANVWDDGTFTLVLPPGRWRVQVMRGEKAIATKDIDVAKDGESSIDLTGR